MLFQTGNEEAVPFLFESMENRDNSPELSESDDVNRMSTHKRKLDKDGFVQPATPDIPKTSLQYGLPSFHIEMDEMDFNATKDMEDVDKESAAKRDSDDSESVLDQNMSNKDETERDVEEVDSGGQRKYLENEIPTRYEPNCKFTEHHSYSKDKTQHCQYTDTEEDILSKTKTMELINLETTEKENKPLSETTMADLFKELSKEAKTAALQFSDSFVQSENYEMFCMKRLDQLIAHAQDLEQIYLKQKEVLRQRLRVISHTLQNI